MGLELWLLHSLSILFLKLVGLNLLPRHPLIDYPFKLVWRVSFTDVVYHEVVRNGPIL